MSTENEQDAPQAQAAADQAAISVPSVAVLNTPQPTVGRIVHFHPAQHPSETMPLAASAAVVTHVYTPGGRMVELYVLPGSWYGSPHYETSIPHADEASPGAASWSWPPRV